MAKKKRQISRNTALAYGSLILATAIWGGATPVIKLTLGYIPIFSFLFYRFLVVCIILLPFAYIELKKNSVSIKDIPTFALLGLTGQSSLILIFAGVKYTSALDAAIIGAVAPLMIIAAGHYFYREKLNRKLEIGLVIATLGTLIVVIEPAVSMHSLDSDVWTRILGNFLIIAYNAVFAAYIIFSKKVMGQKSERVSRTLKSLHIKPSKKSYSPFLITTISFYFALATFLPLALLEAKGLFGKYDFSILEITTTPLLGLLYMSLISSIVAYFAYQWGLENARVSDSAIFGYLGPVFTAPFAFLLLGEIPTAAITIGSLIIGIGVYFAESQRSHM